MAPDDDSFRLPLYCPLIVNGEEGKAASGKQFKRENPADIRQVATIAEQGTLEDARAAIDAARVAFDSNVGNWIYNYKELLGGRRAPGEEPGRRDHPHHEHLHHL